MTAQLRPRQVALIVALSTPPYPTLRDACEQTGVPEDTAWRWKREEAFSTALAAAIEESEQTLMAEARRQAARHVRELLPKAYVAWQVDLEDVDGNVRSKARKDVYSAILPAAGNGGGDSPNGFTFTIKIDNPRETV